MRNSLEGTRLRCDMSSKYEVVLERLPDVCFSRVSFDDGALLVQGGREDGAIAIEVSFPGVHFVGITDEGSRLRLLQDLKGVRGTILRSKSDPVMRQFISESLDTLDGVELSHYILMLGEEIIDVISGYEPDVRMI